MGFCCIPLFPLPPPSCFQPSLRIPSPRGPRRCSSTGQRACPSFIHSWNNTHGRMNIPPPPPGSQSPPLPFPWPPGASPGMRTGSRPAAGPVLPRSVFAQRRQTRPRLPQRRERRSGNRERWEQWEQQPGAAAGSLTSLLAVTSAGSPPAHVRPEEQLAS